MEPNGFYDSTDEYELGKGEVIGPLMTVSVVLRTYDMPWDSVVKEEQPIKFVPLTDIGDDEFDVAVYVPSSLGMILPFDTMTDYLASFIRTAGITFHEYGPDAVSRLGWGDTAEEDT